jgi:hypothetical protein
VVTYVALLLGRVDGLAEALGDDVVRWRALERGVADEQSCEAVEAAEVKVALCALLELVGVADRVQAVSGEV